MPRYFFNLECGQDAVADLEGLELAYAGAARAEADVVARTVAVTLRGQDRDWNGWSVVVRNENGEALATVALEPSLRTISRANG